MQSIDGKAARIDARYRTLLILWFAMLMSVGFLFALTLLIPNPQHPQSDTTIISWTFSAIGACVALVSFVPKQKMLAQATEKQDSGLVITGYIIAFGLSEAAGVLALLLFMVAKGRAYIYIFMISAIAMVAHYPRRTYLLAASYKNQ